MKNDRKPTADEAAGIALSVMIVVAFKKEFRDALPCLEAETVFDLERAGSWHRADPSFSLNTCDAVDLPGDRVAVPVYGSCSLDDIQSLSSVALDIVR